jgi:chromosome segregation ATPase
MRNACYFVAIVIAWTIVGCVTPRRTEPVVLEHQRQIDELEARNQELERRLNQYDSTVKQGIDELEAIRSRSSGMEEEVDEIIALFEQYQRGVDRLARAYNELRATATGSN